MGKTLVNPVPWIIMSTYPGQGLSTDELLFALGKDLERKLARCAQSLSRSDPPTDPNIANTHLSTSRR